MLQSRNVKTFHKTKPLEQIYLHYIFLIRFAYKESPNTVLLLIFRSNCRCYAMCFCVCVCVGVGVRPSETHKNFSEYCKPGQGIIKKLVVKVQSHMSLPFTFILLQVKLLWLRLNHHIKVLSQRFADIPPFDISAELLSCRLIADDCTFSTQKTLTSQQHESFSSEEHQKQVCV